MKQSFDILQVMLTELGPFSLIAALVLSWALFQAAKFIRAFFVLAYKAAKHSKQILFNPFTKSHAMQLILLAGLIFINGERASDALQYFEQMVLDPAYVQSDTSYYLESRFEDVVKQHTNEAQFLTIRDSTRALAREIGCSPSDIYLVAYSECGLDPFRVRTDGVAAGWIQFTTAGLSGMDRNLNQVKQSCASRDATEIMRLTGAYIRKAAAGRKLHNATEFYTAVFAPGKLGGEMDDVLYQGRSNPEYYLNAGLDGYFVESGKVLYLPLRKDGKLTKRDLHAALEFKKSKFLTVGNSLTEVKR